MRLRLIFAIPLACAVAALASAGTPAGPGAVPPAVPPGGSAGTDRGPAAAASAENVRSVLAGLDALYPRLQALYVDLHRSPELSGMEEKTAARMADLLKDLGFAVTTDVGGHGLVGLLRNGDGPTVMLRTDLDALPVEEKTGLPYASGVRVTMGSGESVPVMHACGHDVHMTSWIGAATLLARGRDRWRGTLMMVGQPAEEVGSGARAMIDAGLFTRFPKPDAAFAIHDTADLPAGRAGWTAGYALASADSVDVTIHGKGGHGAYPHKTVDPIVIASRFVLALQTIVSREKNPLEPAVVTVGSIHGGAKHNIIPDEVRLQITVRAYKEEVRDRILEAIRRIARQEAAAAGAPREPEVRVAESTAATYNDPVLARRIAASLEAALGPDRIVETPPVMGSEDFSEYGRAGIPAAVFWVGVVEASRFEEARRTGEALPALHSPLFAPDVERTLRTGVSVVAGAALEILRGGGPVPVPASESRSDASREVMVTPVIVQGWADPLTPPPLQRLTIYRYQTAGRPAAAPRAALLLIPCVACGTGWLDPLARDLVSRGGVEVFTFQRRGVAFEERDRLDALKGGSKGKAEEAIAYYLGSNGKPAAWKRPGPKDLDFLAAWGTRMIHEDLRLAVREVRRLTGLPVLLGGFSGGAGNALGFAARRFDDGRAGHEEIAGLVLLEGALLWTNAEQEKEFKAAVQGWMASMQPESRFWEMRDGQILAEIAADLALDDPEGRSPLAGRVVPPAIAGPGMTNRAFFGWCADLGTPPERGFVGALYEIQSGSLLPPREPGALTSWQDGGGPGEPTRLARVASIARAPGGIFDWYYPIRLLREENDLNLKAYQDPDQQVTDLPRIAVPVFAVTGKSARYFGPEKPPLSGTWLFSRIAARGNEAIEIPEYAHADILLAESAPDRVFAPLHRWILGVVSAPQRPTRQPGEGR